MRELISRFKTFFVFAGLFSLAINALLLVPPIYMLQVFDRVLTSRSEETLVYLTIGGVTALVVMALLDMVRARLLGVAGAALDRTLGPPHYYASEVRAQIKACYDNGVQSWVLWNPRSHYTVDALEPDSAPGKAPRP